MPEHERPQIQVDSPDCTCQSTLACLIPCRIDKIIEIADKHNLYVIEDAAQAIDSYYIGEDGIKKALGSIGHLAAFSFHETKNIISGEGGMLAINDEKFIGRAEIIWEKGTNRSSFFRGEVDKYGWVDIGSSFLASDVTAAFLFAQLENLELIQSQRVKIWDIYWEGLQSLKDRILLPYLPSNASNNAHMFYVVCSGSQERSELIEFLKIEGIYAVFHYLGLHKSPYYVNEYSGNELPNSDMYENGLLRLPFYFELKLSDQEWIISRIKKFFTDEI